MSCCIKVSNVFLLNPEDCLSCTVYICRRNVGASLVEINKGMCELVDKQVDTQNENLKIKILRFTQALVEVVMKIKKNSKKKLLQCKKTSMKGGLYKVVSEDWCDRF